jgi:hypothetical protein
MGHHTAKCLSIFINDLQHHFKNVKKTGEMELSYETGTAQGIQ